MPTANEHNLALDRLHTRTTQCFTLLVWITKVRPHLHAGDDNGAHILVMMNNAAVETALISFRSLNEFFRKRDDRHRSDDVVAEDFHGFISAGPFLSATESRDLNKRVMHLTYQEMPLSGVSWKIADWTARGIPRVIEFLQHLEKSLSPTDPEVARTKREIPSFRQMALQTADLAAREFGARRQ